LTSQFDMKDMGEAAQVFGIEIRRDRAKEFLGISQRSYINKVLKRYGMENCSPIMALIFKGDIMSLKVFPHIVEDKALMSQTPYASVVGSLQYLQGTKDYMLIYKKSVFLEECEAIHYCCAHHGV
ncbi:hypothetical protein, partial [Klebsiella pneumoniae]|uniref:hypothetical protein n=1 Tax=Klebsiella pneumoniae TaxID=573 RepID=UPI003531FE83